MTIIEWPAVLKLAADDELTFIPDRETWVTERQGHMLELDYLVIDSRGSVFRFSSTEKNVSVETLQTNETVSLEYFEELVKRHLVCLEQCCVSKIQLSSILQGMKLLEQCDTNI